MDVRRLVDFVLLKPPGHAAGNGVGSGTRILPIVQLYERVAKQRPFRRINGGDITTDSISESHEYTSQKGQEGRLTNADTASPPPTITRKVDITATYRRLMGLRRKLIIPPYPGKVHSIFVVS